MVEIQSKEAIDKMSEELKVQPALLLPRELGKMIVPTYEINPDKMITRVTSAERATTGTTVMTTAHATKNTFLVGATLTGQADILSDGTSFGLIVTLPGQSIQNILKLSKITLTVYSGQISIAFPEPILLEKSSSISISHTFTVGAQVIGGTAMLHERDPQ